MIPVETVPEIREEGMKISNGGGEFKNNISDAL
jgi:hypothetical protein